MTLPRGHLLLPLLLSGVACSPDTQSDALTYASDSAATNDSEPDSTETEGTGPLLDLGEEPATETEDGALDGCKGVDFLFVVDNSGSMASHQQALVASFPGFIEAMEVQLAEMGADSIQVMVTDTDEVSAWPPHPMCEEACIFQNFTGLCPLTQAPCETYSPMCMNTCMDDPTGTCGPVECAELTGCDDACECALGTGIVEDKDGVDCGILSGSSFMDETQPDPLAAFSCMATVGTGGTGGERPMGSMMAALEGPNNQAGGCNEGFLREEAILVVTIVTDEDDESSPLEPDAWAQAVLAAKNEIEEGVVVLGLISDYGLPGATCIADSGPGGAEAAPRLNSFVDSVERSLAGSICAENYSEFFAEAVGLIDLACEQYTPVP